MVTSKVAISDYLQQLATGEASAIGLVRRSLEAIARDDGRIKAFVDHDPDSCLEQAAALDALPAIARGELHGIPVAIKEIFDVRGMRCRLGSTVLADRIPNTDSPLVRALREAGAVIMGTTVSTEYAIGAVGPTRNPHDLGHSPGGSSSGSAAAVAAGMVPAALGSQTIGSTIRPAAYCGTVGFKPTFDFITPDRDGLILSPHLDHIGVLTSSVDCARRMAGALAGRRIFSGAKVRGAVLIEPWFDEALSPAIEHGLRTAASALAAAGITVRRATVPPQAAQPEARLTHTILCYDLAQRFAGDMGETNSSASPKLQQLIRDGMAISAAEYGEAVNELPELLRQLHSLFDPGEVGLVPATVDVAPPFDKGTGSRAPQRLWTTAGLPALAIPVETAGALPVGVQLVGRRDEDAVVLEAGDLLSRSLARTARP